MFLDKLARAILWVSGFVVGVCAGGSLIYILFNAPIYVTIFVGVVFVVLWAITRVMDIK